MDHLGYNMLYLWFCGPVLEKYLGKLKYSILYLGSGLASAIGFLALFPDAIIVGASGAISGVIALYPFRHNGTLAQMICFAIIAFTFFAEQHLGHLFGAIGGLLIYICILNSKVNK